MTIMKMIMMMIMMIMMMMVMMMMMIMMMMLARGWRPPRGGKSSQRDTALKLISQRFRIRADVDDLW